MNFISNVLDSIPVVGHAKGIVHYAVGDTDGGNKAMYQSTRTTAVLAGGAAGSLAGPAGAVAGAMYAGLATDGLASVAMNEPQGLIQSCENIGNDIAAGRNPTGSIVSTGLQLGLDGVGGLGMGGISSAASKVSEKAVTKTIENVGKKVVTTVGEEVIEKSVKITAEEMGKMVVKKVSEKAVKKTIEQVAIQAEVVLVSAHIGLKAKERTEEEERAEREKRAKEEREQEERKKRAEREKRAKEERERKEREKRPESEKRAEEEREQKERENRAGTNSGSSQPPQGNKDNNKKSKEKSKPDYYDIFMKLLRKLLKLIYGNETETFSRIFENLSRGQIKYLVKVIEEIIVDFGTSDGVVELVIRIFKEHLPKDIAFTNFLSLLEFVRTYINDELNKRIISRGAVTTRPALKYKERREIFIRDITSQTDIVQQLVVQFKTLQAEIEAETSTPNNISPNFRDVFSAVYHYFKHRCVPGDGILTVKEYYDWIRKLLTELKKTPEYAELRNSRDPRTCVYEIYVVLFGRRFRIVVKAQGGKIVLCSAFVCTMMYPGDKEGDVFIKITKL